MGRSAAGGLVQRAGWLSPLGSLGGTHGLRGSGQKVGVSDCFSSLQLRKGLTAFVCFVGRMLCSRMPCECCWRLSFMLISVSVFIIFFFWLSRSLEVFSVKDSRDNLQRGPQPGENHKYEWKSSVLNQYESLGEVT